MKLYLAGPYAGREIIAGLIPLFLNDGHEIVSQWHGATRGVTTDGTVAPEYLGTSPASTDDEVMAHAGQDWREVQLCDVLVHFTAQFIKALAPTLDDMEDRLHSGGRHVESGMALALHKSVIVVGTPENIFLRGLCHLAPALEDALDILNEMSEDWA